MAMNLTGGPFGEHHLGGHSCPLTASEADLPFNAFKNQSQAAS